MRRNWICKTEFDAPFLKFFVPEPFLIETPRLHQDE
jgi:hypothetical protein